MLELASVAQNVVDEDVTGTPDDIATFWQQRLKNSPPSTLAHLNTYKDAAGSRKKGKRIEINTDFCDAINSGSGIFKKYDAVDVYLSLLSVYLFRTSGDVEINFAFCDSAIQTNAARSSRREGTFIPFQVNLDPAQSFQETMEKVTAERETLSRYGALPLSMLDGEGVGDLGPWTGGLPLAVVVKHNSQTTASNLGAVDLVLDMEQRKTTIAFNDFISPDFGDAVLAHLIELAQSAANDPGRPICQLDYLSASERHRILNEWNATNVTYEYGLGLVGRLEAKVAENPDHAAVVFQGVEHTYAEFNARVNRLARYLRKAGVGRDKFVAICLDRTPEMVIAIWAVLKAGGAYVPLNVEDPPQRLASIIRNAGARVILTEEKHAKKLPKSRYKIVLLNPENNAIEKESFENPCFDIGADDLAYMIYTSGSTGEPKGVLIEHKAIWNRIAWMQDEYGLTSEDRVLQKTPYTFDVSVWEFLWPLTEGSTLVVAEPGGHVVPSYLARLMRQERVTCVHFVPSVLRLFLNCPTIEELPLRMVFCSGEALPYELQTLFFSRSGASLNNLYGPTEAAVDVTYWRCTDDLHAGRIPIGKPISNIKMHILDQNLKPVPVGVLGELYIGGIGLARGYWQKPELTQERFIADPFSDGNDERLYQTGDIARYLPDGNIEYMGRNDHQVKINGIRIELGEIESIIRTHASVQDAAVVAKKNDFGNAQLFAYLVPKALGRGASPSITCAGTWRSGCRPT